MKVLFLARYISVDDDSIFNNMSGYGYIVKELAEMLSHEGYEIDLLTHSGFTEQRLLNGIRILKKTKIQLLKSLKLFYCLQGIKFFLYNKNSFHRRIKEMLYFFAAGYLDKILVKNNYDLVHIHGMELFAIPWMQVCAKRKIPTIITLHGLNSLRIDKGVSELDQLIEKKFIRLADERSISYTLVSSGLIERIKKNFIINRVDNIKVILNGTNLNTPVPYGFELDEVKAKYGISESDKIIICVGNISERKNQKEVVKVFGMLEETERENLKLFIIGDKSNSTDIQKLIEIMGMQEQVFLVGKVNKNEISKFYSLADYNITASIDEGFGLPIIEGFTYGIPSIFFSDIDAFNDLFDENCAVVATERTSEDLNMALKSALSKSFDKAYIINYARSFGLEVMTKKYIKLYQERDIINASSKDFMNLIIK